MKAKSNLKKIRESKNITVAVAAEEAGIGISRYFMIETGDRPATAELAVSIANYYGVQVDDIFLPTYFTVRKDSKFMQCEPMLSNNS